MDEDLKFFYEDATDQLQFMENALLDANEGTNDEHIIGEIFRAMHTIKGTAGMFGFDEIVNLTHEAETVLDKVRSGEIELNSKLSNLFMLVKDITSALVERDVNNETANQELINKMDSVKKELHNYIEDIDNEIKESINQENEDLDFKENEEEILWHISLRFEPEFLTTGMDIISILKFLQKRGEILLNIPIIEHIPNIFEINPIETYLGFEIDYYSKSSKDDIVEIFEFVEDDIDLIVIKHEDKKALLELFESREDFLKKLLIDNFSYEEAFFEEKKSSKTNDITPKKEDKKKIEKNETPVDVQKKQSQDDDFFLKVNSKKIDELINQVSQMVIKNSQLTQHLDDSENEEVQDIVNSMNTLLEDVRDGIMKVRMVQVKESFIKYRRIVNDTAKKLNKEINFILEGEETELDKSVVEKLSDPLTHMIRNSCDHGIEDTQTRIKRGKNQKGTIKLKAYTDAGTIVIQIQDDGGGINQEAVLNKAIANDIIPKDHNLTEKEIFMLIFSAGLSTANEVSDLSGRGVGMDVVKRNIEALRGIIEVDSIFGVGTTITVRLPLTLAIIDGFLVQAGHIKYIIPVDMIVECIEYTEEYKSTIEGSKTINIRGEVLPLLNLRKFFQDKITKDELEQLEDYSPNVIIVKFADYQIGLMVDELFGQQQTVIKPLGSIFQNVPGVGGGSILGNGEIALIVDIPKLIEYKTRH